jgi:hypothetical protein
VPLLSLPRLKPISSACARRRPASTKKSISVEDRAASKPHTMAQALKKDSRKGHTRGYSWRWHAICIHAITNTQAQHTSASQSIPLPLGLQVAAVLPSSFTQARIHTNFQHNEFLLASQAREKVESLLLHRMSAKKQKLPQSQKRFKCPQPAP